MSNPAAPETPPSTDEEVRALAREVIANPQHARRLDELDPFEQLRHRAQSLDIQLRKRYAMWILYGLAAQLAVVDVLFFLYAWHGVHWKLSAQTIDVWLGATFVQVLGIIAIVTKYLFPSPADHSGAPPGPR